MKRITADEADWAYSKVLELLELVARQLAHAGEPELARKLREWR